MKTNKKITNRRLLKHGDYSISNCWTKIIAIFRGIFVIFCSNSNSHLKEEALDRIKWRNRFGRGFGPVV